MAEFDAKHRDLKTFLTGLEKKKESSKEGGSKDDVQELDGGREQQVEIKKENVPGNRESQKPSTSAVRRLLRASS